MSDRIVVDERTFADSLNELTDHQIAHMTLGQLMRRAEAYSQRIGADAESGAAS